MKRLVCGLLLSCAFPFAGLAQVIVKNHNTGAAVMSPLLLPDAPVNDIGTTLLDIYNAGTSLVVVQSAVVTGQYFSLCCESGFTLQPGGTETLTLQFAPTAAGNFTGTLWIDNASIFLFARSIATASLFVQTGEGLVQAHSGTPLVITLPSGTAQVGCQLENNSTVPLTVNSISASGGWSLASVPQSPLVLQPGGSANMTLMRAAPSAQSDFTGVVTIDQWSYAIEAHPPMPNVHLQVPNTVLESGQQTTLSVSFDKAPASAITGSVELRFESDTPISLSDPAIVFTSTGTASMRFTSVAGQLAGTFDGSTSATFQTGTTSGTLHITAKWAYSADTVDVHFAPAPIGIDTIAATRESNALDVTVTGFDNTRTAGRMSFSFYDANGGFITTPIAADFTELFSQYFETTAADIGGVFKLTAHFPISGGSPSQINSVQVSLANIAGTAQSAVTPFH